MDAVTSGGVAVVLHSGVQGLNRHPWTAVVARGLELTRAVGRSLSTPSRPALRPGDDTTELEPQGDDEIGRTSLYDAEGEMGHPSALDHPRALQVDRAGAEVVEQ
jgi:hypothetical protein